MDLSQQHGVTATQKARVQRGTLPGRQFPEASVPREERHNQLAMTRLSSPRGMNIPQTIFPSPDPMTSSLLFQIQLGLKVRCLLIQSKITGSTSQGTEQGRASTQWIREDNRGLLSKENLCVFNMLLHQCAKGVLEDSILKLDLPCNFSFSFLLSKMNFWDQ